MFCVKCGNVLSKQARFCKRCGNPVRQRAQMSSPNISQRTKRVTTTIIALALVMSLGIGSIFAWSYFGENNNSSERESSQLSPVSTLREATESLHYIYRNNVTVVNQPPLYSFAEANGTFIITVYNPNNDIRQLAIGETFVLEPTASNPDGIAGHIIFIAEQGSNMIITASIPESLEDIFEEFELAANLDILALADEIILGEDLIGVEGIEIIRNPTSRVYVRAVNANIAGITINGALSLYRPTLHVSINRFNVEYFVIRTGAEVDFTASAQVQLDRVFTLMTVPIWISGVRVDVAFGLRFTVDGHFHLEVTYSIDAEFGYRDGGFVAQITPGLDYNFEFEARAAVSRNIQARASVLSIPIYGVEGNFGRGVQANNAMQDICPNSLCFVMQTFRVRTVGSLDWGLLGRVSAFQFFDDLESSVPAAFRFRHGGNWYDACPHGGNHEGFVPEGDRYYLETDIFSIQAAMRRHPQDGPRTMGRMTFYRGISSIWNGFGGGMITYDISERGFTHLSGVFGKIDTTGLTGELIIVADGAQIFSYTIRDSFETPRTISIELPPDASQIEIYVLASSSWTTGSEFGFMDAFFISDPNFAPPANLFDIDSSIASVPRDRLTVFTYLEQDILGELINIGFSSENQFSRSMGGFMAPTRTYSLLTYPVANIALASVSLGTDAVARYDITGRGYTTLSGTFGFLGSSIHGQRSSLHIYADGARIGVFSITGRTHDHVMQPLSEPIRHIQFDVPIPPGTQIVEIILTPVTNVGTVLRSWVGIGDAFFGR